MGGTFSETDLILKSPRSLGPCNEDESWNLGCVFSSKKSLENTVSFHFLGSKETGFPQIK